MRKISAFFIISVLLCGAPLGLRAAPYGQEYNLQKDFSAEEKAQDGDNAQYSYYTYNKKTSPYLIYKVVKNEPLRICLHVGSKEQQKMSYDDLSIFTQFAVNAWTSHARAMVEKAGRGKEFRDSLPQYPVKLTFVRAQEYVKNGSVQSVIPMDDAGNNCDLLVIYDLDYCPMPTNSGGFFRSKPWPQICLGGAGRNLMRDFQYYDFVANGGQKIYDTLKYQKFYDTSLSTVMHEMGHAFGLGDQYDAGLWNNDVLYSTIKPRNSIMNSVSPVLTCDDLDGIVSLFYRVKGQSKTFKSFCHDGLIIKDGKPVLKKTEEKIVRSADGKDEALYTITPKSSALSVYSDKQKVAKLNSFAEDGKFLKELGFDLSYFKGSGENCYVTFPSSESLPANQQYRILNYGKKAQEIVLTWDDNGKRSLVAGPVNLIRVRDAEGRITYQRAPDQPANNVNVSKIKKVSYAVSNKFKQLKTNIGNTVKEIKYESGVPNRDQPAL